MLLYIFHVANNKYIIKKNIVLSQPDTDLLLLHSWLRNFVLKAAEGLLSLLYEKQPLLFDHELTIQITT